MSRFRRAIHGVASSYVQLAANAVYSLASVPIALHYLDKERFGLWALMSTLVGYLSLVDAGMSSSAARLIIDHKDERDGERYGSFVKTVFTVTLMQGLIIFIIGLVFAGLFGRWLAIPAGLQTEFIRLVILQCIVVALGFATRIFGLILGGHQRMDLVNYAGTLSLAVNFTALWVFFHFGFGVLSLAWAGLCGVVEIVIFQWISCGVLDLFPKRGSWGRVSWSHFQEIFAFGKDIFLVSAGGQLIMASQTIVITRMLGLPAAAVWSIGLRVFSLVSQVVWRISDMSGSAFAEMMVRGEMDRLRERFRAVVMLTASLGGFAAVSFALCNSLFIPLWTHGKIQWPAVNDVLLALWLILMAVSRCYSGLVVLTKKVGFMRYVYFMEGAVFVILSLLVARRGGLAAIIACSILCTTLFSGMYSLRRISRYFNLPLREAGWDWLRPMGRMLLFYLPLALLAWWALTPLPAMTRLGANVMVASSVGSFLFLRYGMTHAFQTELLARMPKRMSPVLRRIFAGSLQ